MKSARVDGERVIPEKPSKKVMQYSISLTSFAQRNYQFLSIEMSITVEIQFIMEDRP